MSDQPNCLPAGDAFQQPEAKRARKGLLIAGMHRSGTSLTAGVVCHIGAAAPASLMGANKFNETGYWESTRFYRLNEQILKKAGSAWHDIMPMGASFFESEASGSYVEQICAAIEDEYRDQDLICIKDPRLSRLLPLWLAAFARLNIEPLIVIPFRNPLDVAASLKRRDDFSLPHSLALWLRHTLDCERHSRGLQRTFVAYEAFLADWRGCVAQIARELNLKWPQFKPITAAQVDRLVSGRYRHHASSREQLAEHPYVSPLVKEAYQALSAASSGEGDDPQKVLSEVALQLEAADLLYVDLLAEAKLELDKEKTARATATAALTQAKVAATEAEQELRQRSERLQEAEAECSNLQTAIAELRKQLEAAEAEHETACKEAEAERAAATAALTQAKAAAIEVEKELRQRSERLASVEAEREQLLGEVTEAREQLKVAKAEHHAEREAARVARDEAETEKTARAAAEKALSEARAAAAEAKETHRRELDQQAERLRTAEGEREALKKEIANISVRLTGRSEEVVKLTQMLQRAEQAFEAAKAAAAEHEKTKEMNNNLIKKNKTLTDEIIILTQALAQKPQLTPQISFNDRAEGKY